MCNLGIGTTKDVKIIQHEIEGKEIAWVSFKYNELNDKDKRDFLSVMRKWVFSEIQKLNK